MKLTEKTDGASGHHGGDRPRPRVPGDAARGREGREDVRGCVKTGRLGARNTLSASPTRPFPVRGTKSSLAHHCVVVVFSKVV